MTWWSDRESHFVAGSWRLGEWPRARVPGGTVPCVWGGLMRRHWRDVELRYVPRAVLAGAFACANYLMQKLEVSTRDARAELKPPLFVLGHYRSGTTFLHQLLSRDPRFASPNLAQVLFPNSFSTMQRVMRAMVGPFLPQTRIVDELPFGLDEPQEEELAILGMTGISPFLGWTFPAFWDDYARYFTLNELSDEERTRWASALTEYLARLQRAHEKPLVLKSPLNTGRIKFLDSLFPGARYVHVHRHPYEVFASVMHYERVFEHSPLALQRARPDDFGRWTLERYRLIHEQYFAYRDQLSPEALLEVRFETLVRDPVGTLRTVYEHLDLGGFEQVVPHIEGYLAQLGPYRRNQHAPLDRATRDLVDRTWAMSFEAWGYARSTGTEGDGSTCILTTPL